MGHRLPVRAQFTTLSMFATRKPLSAISPVMPLMTASCSGPGGRWSRFHANMVASLILLLPLQRAFAPLVDKTHGENAKERDHRPEAECADSLQRNRPWEQERHFEVEDDEKDGYEIIPHIETAARIVKRLKTTFIRRELFGIGLLPGGEQGAHHHGEGNTAADHE